MSRRAFIEDLVKNESLLAEFQNFRSVFRDDKLVQDSYGDDTIIYCRTTNPANYLLYHKKWFYVVHDERWYEYALALALAYTADKFRIGRRRHSCGTLVGAILVAYLAEVSTNPPLENIPLALGIVTRYKKLVHIAVQLIAQACGDDRHHSFDFRFTRFLFPLMAHEHEVGHLQQRDKGLASYKADLVAEAEVIRMWVVGVAMKYANDDSDTSKAVTRRMAVAYLKAIQSHRTYEEVLCDIWMTKRLISIVGMTMSSLIEMPQEVLPRIMNVVQLFHQCVIRLAEMRTLSRILDGTRDISAAHEADEEFRARGLGAHLYALAYISIQMDEQGKRTDIPPVVNRYLADVGSFRQKADFAVKQITYMFQPSKMKQLERIGEERMRDKSFTKEAAVAEVLKALNIQPKESPT